MTIRYGANGKPMKNQGEPQEEVLQEILSVNPNKKKKKVEDVKDEEL